MKLCIVTPIFKRPELTKLCLEYYRETFPEVDIIAIRTRGDFQADIKGVNYFEFPNDDLPQKFNECFLRAREFNPEAVVLTGSNDILSRGAIACHWGNHLRENSVYGLGDFYLYERQSKKAIHWNGLALYNNEQFPIGCGRYFTKKVLDKLDWRPYGDLKMQRGLDTNSSLYMQGKGIKHISQETIQPTFDKYGEQNKDEFKMGIMGIGIKDNLTKTINPFEGWLLNGEYCDSKPLYDTFPSFFKKLHGSIVDMDNWPKGMVKATIIHKSIGIPGESLTIDSMTALGLYRNGLIEMPVAIEIAYMENVTPINE